MMIHYFVRFDSNIIYIERTLSLVNELTELFNFQDNEELSRAVASVKPDILSDGQTHSLKKSSTKYFSLTKTLLRTNQIPHAFR